MRLFRFYQFLLFTALATLSSSSKAQVRHLDYLGAGHTNKMKVTSSSSQSKPPSETINGFHINNQLQLKDASRFLSHATFGADWSTINMVAAMGKEAWLEEQYQLPIWKYHDEVEDQTRAGYGFGYRLFGSTWMTNNIATPDLLRQRMAFNLSQINVLSGNTMMIFQRTDAHPLCAYYDILMRNSFGNYADLLYDVSLSPQMGHFLSHYNNPKADTINNVHPDENYAREIMQLFSIGLYELNIDGSRKKDSNGMDIATYNNDDIKEMAQVFTGLGPVYSARDFGAPFSQGVEAWQLPMSMYEDFHDQSEKELPGGLNIPAGQAGLDDIRMTINHLTEHPSAAPFLAKALIQMFTTSNPSSQYIADVAMSFDQSQTDNLQVVIKTILLHPEANTCAPTADYSFGKLREPMVRLLNLLRAFPMRSNENGDYFNFLRCPIHTLGQAPLQSPSVFNFFSRDYAPQGEIINNNLVAPEFEILSAPNAIAYLNDLDTRILGDLLMDDGCGIFGMFEPMAYQEDISQYTFDYSSLDDVVDDNIALINRLDLIIANGSLSEMTKRIIVNTLGQIDDLDIRLKLAIWAIMISPDYVIAK